MDVKIPAQEAVLLRKNISVCESMMTTFNFQFPWLFYCRRPVNLKVGTNPLNAEKLQGRQPQPRDHIRASDAFCS